MNASRRALRFASLDQVMPDVDRLLEGHTTVGRWSLGQICNHLAQTICYTVEGFPVKLPWLVRKTVGPLILRRILATERFPEGTKAPKQVLPSPEAEARAE